MRRWAASFERSATLYRAEKWLQTHVGGHPSVYFPLHSLTGRNSRQVVGPGTEIVIEGYPRSANSFAVVAFRRAQRRKVRIANNLHVPAQVIRAARLRIPTLLLLRNPEDAVLSLAIRDPISLGQALKYYVSFHESVAEYSGSYVLGLFEEVTADYGAVIERVNTRFGTDFVPFRHTTKDVKRVFTGIERVYEKNFSGAASMEDVVSRPSSARGETKQRLKDELEAPRHRELLARAKVVHERLVSEAR